MGVLKINFISSLQFEITSHNNDDDDDDDIQSILNYWIYNYYDTFTKQIQINKKVYGLHNIVM